MFYALFIPFLVVVSVLVAAWSDAAETKAYAAAPAAAAAAYGLGYFLVARLFLSGGRRKETFVMTEMQRMALEPLTNKINEA